MSGYTAMQCSCPRVMTSPEASSSRNFAGKIRRPFSSSLGVKVPRNISALLHLPRLAIRTPSPPNALHFTPLVPTIGHRTAEITEHERYLAWSAGWGEVGGNSRRACPPACSGTARSCRGAAVAATLRANAQVSAPSRGTAMVWGGRWRGGGTRGGAMWGIAGSAGREPGHRPGAGDRSVTVPSPDVTMPRLVRAGASSGIGAAVPRRRGGRSEPGVVPGALLPALLPPAHEGPAVASGGRRSGPTAAASAVGGALARRRAAGPGDRVDRSREHADEGDHSEPDRRHAHCQHQDPESHDHGAQADQDPTPAASRRRLRCESSCEARIVSEELALHLVEHLLLVFRQRHDPAPCPRPLAPVGAHPPSEDPGPRRRCIQFRACS